MASPLNWPLIFDRFTRSGPAAGRVLSPVFRVLALVVVKSVFRFFKQLDVRLTRLSAFSPPQSASITLEILQAWAK